MSPARRLPPQKAAGLPARSAPTCSERSLTSLCSGADPANSAAASLLWRREPAQVGRGGGGGGLGPAARRAGQQPGS
jgi:hypothetical protein